MILLLISMKCWTHFRFQWLLNALWNCLKVRNSAVILLYSSFVQVLEPQYIETLNNRFETNLRLSSLINKGAMAENLKTGNGRIYNDVTVEQILKFHFAENRQNVGIYGVTGAGKSYFLSACCVEACRRNYRCKFVDYSDLLDELIVLNRQEDLNAFCGAQRTSMRFRADAVRSITDALKRLLLSVSFWAGSLQCSVSLPVSVSHWLILRH